MFTFYQGKGRTWATSSTNQAFAVQGFLGYIVSLSVSTAQEVVPRKKHLCANYNWEATMHKPCLVSRSFRAKSFGAGFGVYTPYVLHK